MHDIKLSGEDIEGVKAQIKSAWESIKAVDFTAVCEYEDCDFCRL